MEEEGKEGREGEVSLSNWRDRVIEGIVIGIIIVIIAYVIIHLPGSPFNICNTAMNCTYYE